VHKLGFYILTVTEMMYCILLVCNFCEIKTIFLTAEMNSTGKITLGLTDKSLVVTIITLLAPRLTLWPHMNNVIRGCKTQSMRKLLVTILTHVSLMSTYK